MASKLYRLHRLDAPLTPMEESAPLQAAWERLLTTFDLHSTPTETRELLRTIFFIGADTAFNRMSIPGETIGPSGQSTAEQMSEKLDDIERLKHELRDFWIEFLDVVDKERTQ